MRHTRYSALREMHSRLEDAIDAEMHRPLPDPLELQRLKRRKLIVREEMAAWEQLVQVLTRRQDRMPPPGRIRPTKRASRPAAA